MELLVIYKISPGPSLPKRGRKWKSLLRRGKRKDRKYLRDCAKTHYFLQRERIIMYDVVTFGEAMIRLSPPNSQRLEQTQSLDVHVGGAELNVAVGVTRFGMKSAWVSKLPEKWSWIHDSGKGSGLWRGLLSTLSGPTRKSGALLCRIWGIPKGFERPL